MRIFQDDKWSFSLENISAFDRLIVFLQIELVSSVDVDGQESSNPVEVLVEGNESVFVFINEAENEQENTSSNSADVQKFVGIVEDN